MSSICIFFLLYAVLAEKRFCYSSEVYIVYMGSKRMVEPKEISKQNHLLLASVQDGSLEKARASHVYSYKHGFRGFAAKLSNKQALMISGMAGVVSVFPNEKRLLHTTRSWDFIGVSTDEDMEIPGFSTKNQENVVIGFIDTGIWPESPSFHDNGMPPVPSRWRRICQGNKFTNFSCNKKIIGARYYLRGYEAEESNSITKFRSPRDSSGHGSHTASIASGRFVNNMNYNGLGNGAARGGVPMSRIAVYKACWDSGCYDADLLAAFDDAIKDGVDIISVSLGPNSPQGDYFRDSISVGSFHAVSHGILVIASAGNVGTRGSATNLAPWMLTVAASSTDRDFSSEIVLGSRTKLMGESLNTFRMNASAPTILASEVSNGFFTPFQSSFCLDSSLNKTMARGKILICHHSGSSSESRIRKSIVVKKVGGIGMILVDETENDVAFPFAIPAATVGKKAGERVQNYVKRTKNARSLIFPAKTIMGSRRAPRMAAFSSKGPNLLTPGILKPDITAPGLNILAAWSPADNKMEFNILSGTSMACPHITGLAALIKAVHPSWSPSSIKSALMTTATVFDKNGRFIKADPSGRRANAFDYGSGFPTPSRMLDPGLIYDVEVSDYRAFLCLAGYNDKYLNLVTGESNSSCSQLNQVPNLNYPAITVPDLNGSYSVTREVTNMGRARSLYRSLVISPKGIDVTVVPDVLSFRSNGEKINFTVYFRVATPSKDYVFGSLLWSSRRINAKGGQILAPLLPELQPPTESAENEDSGGGASFSSAVFNISTSIIGAGIMSIPATLRVLGVVPAMAIMAAVALLCDVSVEFLTRYTAAGESSPTTSYSGLMAKSFGLVGSAGLQIFVALTNLGSLIMYLIIIGDVLSGNRTEGVDHLGVLQEWFGEEWWTARSATIPITVVVVMLPLVLLRRVDSLRFTSAISILLAVIFVLISSGMALYALIQGTIKTPRLLPDLHKQSFLELFTAIPVIVVAFTFHFNVHPIRSELSRVADMKPAVRVSLLLCTVIYAVVGLSGYLLFGDDTMADVLSNFDQSPASPILDDVVRLSYALHLVLVFPLLFYSLRLNIDGLVFPKSQRRPLTTDAGRFLFLTAILLALVYLAAIAIPNIWTVFQFVGSTATVGISLIFPSAVVLRDIYGISKRNDKVLAGIMIIVAAITSCVAIYSNITSLFGDEQKSSRSH